MFHRHAAPAFDAPHAPLSTGGAWYVSDETYHAAIRRGMQLRSEVFAQVFAGLGRAVAGVFKR